MQALQESLDAAYLCDRLPLLGGQEGQETLFGLKPEDLAPSRPLSKDDHALVLRKLEENLLLRCKSLLVQLKGEQDADMSATELYSKVGMDSADVEKTTNKY